MIIQAYQCSVCKSIYKTQAKQVGCQSRCTKEKNQQKKEAAEKAALLALKDYPRLNATSFPHFAELIREYAKQIWNVDIQLEFEISYNPKVSNSHDSPIGKPTNWCAKDDSRPSNYPGYTGHIRGKIEVPKGAKNKDCFLSHEPISACTILDDGWSNRPIRGINVSNVNSGGSFDGSVILFLDDFPIIKKNVEEMQTRQKQLLGYQAEIMNSVDELIDADTELNTLIKQRTGVQTDILQLQSVVTGITVNINNIKAERYLNHATSLIDKAKQEHEAWKVQNVI